MPQVRRQREPENMQWTRGAGRAGPKLFRKLMLRVTTRQRPRWQRQVMPQARRQRADAQAAAVPSVRGGLDSLPPARRLPH